MPNIQRGKRWTKVSQETLAYDRSIKSLRRFNIHNKKLLNTNNLKGKLYSYTTKAKSSISSRKVTLNSSSSYDAYKEYKQGVIFYRIGRDLAEAWLESIDYKSAEQIRREKEQEIREKKQREVERKWQRDAQRQMVEDRLNKADQQNYNYFRDRRLSNKYGLGLDMDFGNYTSGGNSSVYDFGIDYSYFEDDSLANEFPSILGDDYIYKSELPDFFDPSGSGGCF